MISFEASDCANYTAIIPHQECHSRHASFLVTFCSRILRSSWRPPLMSNTPQRREFKTELKQLLDLIIHSLYTKKEIFLRELISNAADAIDRARFESLTNQAILEGNSDWKIKLIPDAKAGTLTVSDNGIGMSRDSIVENLGTIARSGTKAFLESLRQANAKDRPELIGQFGVGFYASFMVADRVTVISRPAGKPEDGVKWESDGLRE